MRPVFLLLFLLILTAPALAQVPKADLVVVHKAQRSLELWSNGEILAKYRVALGFNPTGTKQYAGDGRTPEGVYMIDRKNERSEYYKSLHINYPNAIDEARARAMDLPAGSAIMIHGLPNDRDAAAMDHPNRDWTEGCIAVNDDEMADIWDRVNAGTPILIMP